MWSHVVSAKRPNGGVVDEDGSLLSSSSSIQTVEAAVVRGNRVMLPSGGTARSQMTATCSRTRDSRGQSRTTCCRAFGLGLLYGVSIATVLSLVVLYVELHHVKMELSTVQHQLLQHQKHHHQHHHHRQHTSGEQGSNDLMNDIDERADDQHEADDFVLSNHVENEHDAEHRASRVRRSTLHRRSPNVNGNSITQEQVRQMIQDRLSLMYHPSAHLTFYSLNNSHNDHFLHWTEHDSSRLTHNTLFRYGSDYSRLVILHPGTYFIYVQVMYNGRKTSSQPTCSHAVKLIARDQQHDPKSLLFSSSTQYNLGRPIYVQYDGSYVRAYDSSFQSGLFHLEEGDQLRVEKDDFSRNCIVVPGVDRTFFGGFRLQSAFTDPDS